MIMLARSETPSFFLNMPYLRATLPCGQKSQRSLVFLIPRLVAQAFLEGWVSTLMPTAMAFRVSKAFLFVSSAFICSAQTLVQASGWNERSIFLPLSLESLESLESLKSFSFWSSRVKFRALSPVLGLVTKFLFPL